ncbi:MULTISPECIES: hypothetical protein [unclassified Tateyamaria]|uniref:GTA head formation protein, RCAP_rcc01685 family n=1 Tax=unclassified Tateyamaria TaxID=2645127 RepID=UPI00057FB86A|nr:MULTISPECIES: hypothetical protein [unclassified Tateyamaria]KIC49110.1 gene transfer agent protein [Tateyamaria sp. ANG-S1]
MDDAKLWEKFACGPGLKLEAHERLTEVHFANISDRLQRLETLMERLEKRLWLTVYGVVAVVLATGFQSIMAAIPH